ncbi:peptidoglycan DD-metalloendopeptidase family protein [Pseudovibrio exalbescens]|uniref:murein hydrolase activator EnvC family protein n=1 Tax=Pseudovibrio exalbescens TaxID=197461 RepID=UPI002366E10C|nr:peptidoglycan DD-metalloendopeptidase family protein [Pseudovibrio exalbescens]MDD7909821.1 peptidoglycan DD-metalloendopeptidase family protein [Pseudovibrio exalbescens]
MRRASPSHLFSAGLALVVAAGLLFGTGVSSRAQDTADAAPLTAEEKAQQKRHDRERELRDVTRDISISEERLEQINRTMRALDRDRKSLNEELIRTGERMKTLESQLNATERRLARHQVNEDAVRASLNERRGTLAEVLAALQRIGHRPPPAMAVRPRDALAAVRSAILLNAVMPDVRIEAEALASDLAELTRLRSSIQEEYDRIRAGATKLAEEQHKVELLLAEKQQQRTQSAQMLDAERKRAEELAAKATSLKQLLANLENEVSSARNAAEAARRSDRQHAEGRRGYADPFSDPGRLSPQIPFADAKGFLPRPVSGTLLQDYGVADGFGNKTNGQSYVTRANAQITAPADGWVAYAGDFRSYGQLIILNAGNGHHILLAGMDQINVELGQFVLAGEPVARMGDTRVASVANLNFGSEQPVLYVEFRKDGTAIDPKPWWSNADNEKVRG